MTTEIFIRAVGEPKPQPRQRSFIVRGKGGKPVLTASGDVIVRSADPATAEGWKNQIAVAAAAVVPGEPLEGPVAVDVNLLFPRPKRLCRAKDPVGRIRHFARPDRDNSDKAILDCLKLLGFFRDDAQVCEGSVRKFYAALGEKPGAEIRIRALAATAIEDLLEAKRGEQWQDTADQSSSSGN